LYGTFLLREQKARSLHEWCLALYVRKFYVIVKLGELESRIES
jgi:hypothetical protein